jgi:3-deoxy-D-manno-octulosonate 8-phosphate phosphatase KdsC-like HAD superfamily phosphatase
MQNTVLTLSVDGSLLDPELFLSTNGKSLLAFDVEMQQ